MKKIHYGEELVEIDVEYFKRMSPLFNLQTSELKYRSAHLDIIVHFLKTHEWPNTEIPWNEIQSLANGLFNLQLDILAPANMIQNSDMQNGMVSLFQSSYRRQIYTFCCKIIKLMSINSDYVFKHGSTPNIAHCFPPAFASSEIRKILKEYNIQCEFGSDIVGISINTTNWNNIAEDSIVGIANNHCVKAIINL